MCTHPTVPVSAASWPSIVIADATVELQGATTCAWGPGRERAAPIYAGERAKHAFELRYHGMAVLIMTRFMIAEHLWRRNEPSSIERIDT